MIERAVMNKEAEEILRDALEPLRMRTYEELSELVFEKRVDTLEIRSASGRRYDIEIQYFWDGVDDGDIRVIGSVSEQNSFSTFRPISADFIKCRDGTFRNE